MEELESAVEDKEAAVRVVEKKSQSLVCTEWYRSNQVSLIRLYMYVDVRMVYLFNVYALYTYNIVCCVS